MIRSILLAAAALALSVAAAQADEVWTSEIGEIVYEVDLDNGMAVLSYPSGEDSRGRAYIAGLAGVYEGRGTYDGIWVEETDGEGLCAVAIANPETGEPEHSWGRIEVIFVDPDFPSVFVAQRADCFDAPRDALVARPVTN